MKNHFKVVVDPRKFELALPSAFRRELYRKLASCSVGRNQIVFAQLPKS